MTDESTSREPIFAGPEGSVSLGTVEVLYVDSDAAARERTRTAMTDRRSALSVASVGTVAAALDVAAATPPSCLVVDPVGLDDLGPLLDALAAPVVVYTDRDTAALDESLVEAMRTVVEKGPTNRGAFLAEKVVSTVDTPPARSESALQQALDGVARQVGAGQAVFLVDDGDVVWSNTTLAALVGSSDPPDTDDIYTQLAAVCDDHTVEQFRDGPARTVTVRTNERHFLLQRYPLDRSGEATALVLVRDITDPASRDARLAMLEHLTEQAQDGLYTLDERGVIDFCNDSFAENLGYEPAELRGEHAEKTLAPGELAVGQRTIAQLLDADADSTTVDLTFQRKDGTEREIAIHYTLLYDADGDYSGLMGVTRDITDRIERERELERRQELFDGLVDHFPKGAVLLFDDDCRYTMAGGDELARMGLDSEAILRKRPSDAFPPEYADLLERAHTAALDGEHNDFTVSFAGRHYEIQTIPIRDSEGTVVSGMALVRNVTEGTERQRELRAQRDELATLAQIHGLIHDVIGALGSAATRTAIEETVCERLVESELYQFAWIGEREGASTRLRRRTVAGDDDSYLAIVSERATGGESLGTEAIRTGDAQVVHDIATDDRVASWRDAALAREFRSALVVPLRHDEAIHGVLAVYANRPDAFGERAVDAFRVLGEMVGFAYTAVQNRQLLTDDRVIEMEFRSTAEDAYPVGVAAAHDCVIRGAGDVDLGDAVLSYLTVEGTSPAAVLSALCAHELVSDGRVIRTDEDGGLIELKAAESYRSILLDAGVRPVDVVVDPDGITITVEASPDAEPRTILDTLSDHEPGFELVVKRARARQPTTGTDEPSLRDGLTARQLEVLRAAYLAGYYEWPRDSTAEQLADSLDIASSTLHQHLRRAERNLFRELLEV